jgi:hypothetical protein
VTLPNFIVIGAAKAGTTALYWYLAEHPAIFMSPVKETNYFAYGVDDAGQLIYGDPEVHRFPVKTLAEYERLFTGSGGATAIGEVSPIYLECPQAAGRIRRLLPRVHLICCLREPVERAYSDYLMFLRNRGRRVDPKRDFAETADWARPDSHWMRVSKYYEQLARYYECFPRSQIHVFLFDDLKQNRTGTVQDLYRFVEVDPTFVPDFDTPHNVGGIPVSMLLERVLTKSRLKSVVEPWIRKRTANWLRRLRTRSMRQAPGLPTGLKRQLSDYFREDIAKTSELIGRDLQHWLAAAR